jgi:hypothetical protein
MVSGIYLAVVEAYGGVDVKILIFFTPALVGAEWSASHTYRFTPEERAPSTHWIGSWVDPRVGLDDVAKHKFDIPAPNQ